VIDLLDEPQRIAFIGDVHMNTDWTVRAIRHAANRGADVIVQLGDYGYTFDASFVRSVEEALAVANLPLLFVDGNHEDFDLLLRQPVGAGCVRHLSAHVAHLPRGFRWEWGAVHFLAMGGAHSVDRPYRTPGVSWWPEEAITDEQVREAAEAGTTDVLISHDCPAGVVIPGIDDRTGPPPFPPLEILRSNEHRQVLRGLVDAVQPSAIWHGHYHVQHQTIADFGYGAVVVNGLDCDGTQLGRNVAVVDVADLLVRPVSTAI
jgi:predicted phosphodiesterase